jgi:hypothetical protein
MYAFQAGVIMSGNKITNDEYRDIVRSFLTNEQNTKSTNIKEARVRTLSEQENTNTDVLIVTNQLEYAFAEALEELGADASAADSIASMLKTSAYLGAAIENGLASYKKKLDMMGGQPKPRNI